MKATREEMLAQGLLRHQMVSLEILEDVLRTHNLSDGETGIITALVKRRISTEDRLRRIIDEERGAPGTASSTLDMPSASKVPGSTQVPASALALPVAPPCRYVRLQLLGQGHAGPVWLAYDLTARKKVVVKQLAMPGEEPFPETLASVRAASRVAHPAIVPIVDVGEMSIAGGPNTHYVATEYVEGTTLDKTSLTIERGLRLLRDAANAVHFAHTQGVAHGNLKLRNIIQAKDGRIRIMDFGLPPSISSPFLAPEQIKVRHLTAGPLVDVYSLGATMYAMATGQSPYGNTTGDELCNKITLEPPPSPRAVRPDVPEEVERMIFRALDKNPAKRYRTAGLLAEDLDRWLQRKPLLTDAEMHEVLARQLLRGGRLEESIHHFRELKRRTKAEGPLVKVRAELEKASDDLKASGTTGGLLERGHSRLALSVVQFLTGQDPTETTAGAIMDFEKVLDTDPASFEAALGRGVSLLLRARFPGHEDAAVINLERALQDFSEASKSPPLRASALHNRAITKFYLYRKSKDRGEPGTDLVQAAVLDLGAAIAADPLFAFGWKDLGVMKLSIARADAAKKKMPKAVLQEVQQALTKALELCPDLDGALMERGKVLFGLRRYAEAILDWRKCGEISSSRAKEVKPLIEDAEKLLVTPAPPNVD